MFADTLKETAGHFGTLLHRAWNRDGRRNYLPGTDAAVAAILVDIFDHSNATHRGLMTLS
jgi:hypothetical protein